MSFFNIPAEADIQLLNDFLDQFPDIEGEGRYQTKKFNDIQHKTGTITYKVITQSQTFLDIITYSAEASSASMTTNRTKPKKDPPKKF